MPAPYTDIRDRILKLLLENNGQPMTDAAIADQLAVNVGAIRAIGKTFFRIQYIQQFQPVGNALYCVAIAGGMGGAVELLLENGGFTKLQAEEEEKEQRKKRKEEIDLLNAENILKNYPSTKWMARVAFGLSIITFLMSLKKCN